MRIKELRTRIGIQQKDMASALGIGQSTLSQYETGARQPDYATLQKIANYLMSPSTTFWGAPPKVIQKPPPLLFPAASGFLS